MWDKRESNEHISCKHHSGCRAAYRKPNIRENQNLELEQGIDGLLL